MFVSNSKHLETFQYSFEALVYKGKLESNGIEAFIKDNHTIDAYPLYSNAIGGVKLFVKTEDFEKAKQIIAEISKYSLDDKQDLLKCPKCAAQKIEMETSIYDIKSFFRFLIGNIITPLFISLKHKYRCENCGFEFDKN